MLARSRDQKIQVLLKKLTATRFVVAGLMTLCLLLAVDNLRMRGSERVVIKVEPKSDSQYWVERDQVSNALLEDLSENILRLTLNIVPETAHARIERILRFVHPSRYGFVKAKLTEDADYVVRQEISQMFLPKTFVIENGGRSVLVKGLLTHWISGEKIIKESIGYRVNYVIESGVPLVMKIEEVDVS